MRTHLNLGGGRARIGALAFVMASAAAAAVPADARPAHEQSRASATRAAYDKVQALSIQLEAQAAHARDEARRDERRGGRDEVTDRMDEFVENAHELRELTHEDDVAAARINDQIRKLVDDGRRVQKEWAKAKRRSPSTEEAWNRVLATLDQLNHQFMAATGLAVDHPVGTSGRYEAPPDSTPWFDAHGGVLDDLDRRASSAVRLSTGLDAATARDIRSLRDELRSFGRAAPSTSRTEARDRVLRLLAEARDLQRRLAGPDAPAALRDDISAIVGALVQLREQTADRVTGTSGTGAWPAASNRDRYGLMTPGELWTELTVRTARAADIAAASGSEAVASEIARLQDHLREFNAESAGMDRDDRRDRLDNLLEDAQDTQRDLARGRASSELIEHWNAVVELLVRLRDAA